MIEEKQERTVIHLEIDNKHYYYGSIAKLCEDNPKEVIGIGYASLRNYGLSETKPYQNSKCIIRKGILHTKSGLRGKKSILDND